MTTVTTSGTDGRGERRVGTSEITVRPGKMCHEDVSLRQGHDLVYVLARDVSELAQELQCRADARDRGRDREPALSPLTTLPVPGDVVRVVNARRGDVLGGRYGWDRRCVVMSDADAGTVRLDGDVRPFWWDGQRYAYEVSPELYLVAAP